jgi:hypothetical protein
MVVGAHRRPAATVCAVQGASKGHDDPSDFADVLTDDALWAKKTLAHNWTRVIDKLARDEEGLPQMLRSKCVRLLLLP